MQLEKIEGFDENTRFGSVKLFLRDFGIFMLNFRVQQRNLEKFKTNLGMK